MSIVDDLKTEAAKLLAEAEKVEAGVKKAVVDAFTPAEELKADVAKVETAAKADVTKVETDAHADVTKVDTDVKSAVDGVKTKAAAVETKVAAVVDVAKAPVAQFKGKKVCGVQYAADGLTIEWKG
jgi:hypothetical protein